MSPNVTLQFYEQSIHKVHIIQMWPATHGSDDVAQRDWFGLLVFNDTFSTNRLYCVMDV